MILPAVEKVKDWGGSMALFMVRIGMEGGYHAAKIRKILLSVPAAESQFDIQADNAGSRGGEILSLFADSFLKLYRSLIGPSLNPCAFHFVAEASASMCSLYSCSCFLGRKKTRFRKKAAPRSPVAIKSRLDHAFVA